MAREGAEGEATGVADVLRVLLEDRERREKEADERMRVMQRQVEALERLVTESSRREPAAHHGLGAGQPKLTKLAEDDDIEAYLTTFERLMAVFEVDRARWSYMLAPQLTGKAQKAFAAMDDDQTGDYDVLKAAILKRYGINEEAYRQRLRGITKRSDETHRELATRVLELTRKWLQEHKTVGEVVEAVATEQLLISMSEDVRVWVRERKPKTSAEAGDLADDYAQARKSGRTSLSRQEKRPVSSSTVKCFSCGQQGHRSPECPKNSRREDSRTREEQSGGRRPEGSGAARGTTPGPRTDRREPKCYECGKLGHIATRCPSRALYGEGIQHSEVNGEARRSGDVYRSGTVDGRLITDILLDTGCTRTMVHERLIPRKRKTNGEVVIRCAHGDEVSYPLTEVQIAVGGRVFTVEAGVSHTLPVSVLLGTDVPHLVYFLKDEQPEEAGVQDEALAVVTRAQARRQEEETTTLELKEHASGVQPRALPRLESEPESNSRSTEGDDGLAGVVGAEFDEELFTAGRERMKQTRKQKRVQRREYATAAEQRHPLDKLSINELRTLQQEDDTLVAARKAAEGEQSAAAHGFYYKNGVLYHQWTPPGRDAETMTVHQLVLPSLYRTTVLQLAHSIPLAGHFGKNKTAERVRQRFHWPTLFRDVENFVRSCEECQRCSPRRGPRAPMVPLPIIDEPFQKIAMDIVGPLPRSRSGNKFILVVCDYATRYPEAVALRSVDAEHVAEALVSIFSRVGVQKEILTDQGTNFTSRLLSELYRLLRVRAVRTSPYHPQTDGLVERFNRTLKGMLRKTISEEGKDWDKLLPYVLFAYREIPQSSTGFSPFELLYERAVRGPLDILRESWEANESGDVSVASYILSIQEKLARMTELAHENSAQAKAHQKAWYDKNAREREFQPGEQVLVLLPSSSSKLLAQWQGPYPVVRRVGEVNYEVDMVGKKKRRRVFHVNMLRAWYTPTATDCLAEEVVAGGPDDIVLCGEDSTEEGAPVISDELSLMQKKELGEVLEEFSTILQNTPGRTTLAEHCIDVGAARPVRLPPYRLPHAYREQVQEELKEMEANEIIEPSASEWAAPVVLVAKKDGSLRFCVDYRKLNSVTSCDAYPMPRVDELIDKLGSAAYITTLDLIRGYWQVPVEERCRPLMAFVTPFGLYQFKMMPFGLSGAPATFQRLMDQVLRGLDTFSAAYLDDVVIFSASWSEHLKHLRAVLQRLREAGLTVKPRKCQFGMKQCSYLGHIVGSGVVQPELPKLQAVESFPTPQTKKQVRGFLGLTGYYRKFIPNYAEVASPLTDLTKKSAPTRVVWTEACEVAFQVLKKSLCSTPVLRGPNFAKPFVLQTDASERGVGAVLAQVGDDGEEHPIAYFSRKLLPREEKFSTIEKECLAIKLACQSFRVYLLGKKFTILTDHRALEWLDRLKKTTRD